MLAGGTGRWSVTTAYRSAQKKIYDTAAWGNGRSAGMRSQGFGTELPFQHPDLLAQRGLGDEEPLGRAGEVQFLRGGHEVAQIPPVHVNHNHLSHHGLAGAPGP